MGRRLNNHLMNLYNRVYYDEFMKHLKPQSRTVYRCTLGKFLEQLDGKDLATISVDDIINYTNKENELKHIKSLLIYIAKNNLNGSLRNMDKKLLVWLL